MKTELFNRGGDAALLRFLMDYDLSAHDVNDAPETEGLNEQKDQSLNVFQQWWMQCLLDGKIVGSHLDGWQTEISVNDFYNSFSQQIKADGYRGYPPTKIQVGKMLKNMAPEWGRNRVMAGSVRKYLLPSLDDVRREWDAHRGFKTDWN